MIPPGFTGSRLDRADRLRHDPARLAAALADGNARLLMLRDGEPEVSDRGELVWTPLDDAPEGAQLLLLGIDPDGGARVAAFVPGMRLPAGRSAALAGALERLRADQAAIYAGARSLIDWHARHGFCANCGAATAPFRAGWARACPGCGAEHFPRVDPVVIMIADHGGRALLGRQASWPARRYSALAGFLEPGESIEEAVAREIAEEAGITVGNVRYVASQPWPFPSSLMIACTAEAVDDSISLDDQELEDAIWVPRATVRHVLAGGKGPFLPPPPYAIAYTLLRAWAAQ